MDPKDLPNTQPMRKFRRVLILLQFGIGLLLCWVLYYGIGVLGQ